MSAIGHWRIRGNKIELRAYIGRDPLTREKKYKTKTIPMCGERDADRAAAEFALSVRRPTVSTGVTFGEIAERWFASRAGGWAPAGVAENRRVLDTTLKPLYDVPLDRIDTPMLDEFYSALRARGGRCRKRTPCLTPKCDHGGGGPLSAATVARYHGAIVRPALELARRYEWISRNPADGAHPGDVDQVETEAPEPDEVAKVLTLARKEDPEFLPFLWLEGVTGARLGELLAVRYSRIGEGELRLSHVISRGPSGPVEVPKRSKNKGRMRTIALGPATSSLLASHRARMAERALKFGACLPADAFVFSDEPDGCRPWRPDSTSRRFRNLRDDAGVPHVRFHHLRRFVATMGLDAGFALPTVAGHLGHGDGGRTTLSHYAARRAPTDQALAEFLEELLGLPGTATG